MKSRNECWLEKKDELCWLFCIYCHLFRSVFFFFCPDLCPRTRSLSISCPLTFCWFQSRGGITRRKGVRGQSYQVLISTSPQLPSSQNMFLTEAMFLSMCPLLWGKPPFTAAAITEFWYDHALAFPIRLWSSNGFSLWAPECFTSPFQFS